jgi:Flp pilus assembly protein TadB
VIVRARDWVSSGIEGNPAPAVNIEMAADSGICRRRRRSIPRHGAEAIRKINRVRRGRRRPKGSDGGEGFPPVSCSERGDREAGSDVFLLYVDVVIVVIVVETIIIALVAVVIVIVVLVVVLIHPSVYGPPFSSAR